MTDVIFKSAVYEYDILKTAVFGMLDTIGADLIRKQSRVLIKPNLLLPVKPEKAVLTHPLVVKAVAEYVIAKGGHPRISDSPAIGSFGRLLKEGGYKKAFDDLDVEIRPFKATTRVNIGKPFYDIDIARSAVEADVVINLAKLKTHTHMLLTLGVKNLFGCIVGFKKPEWHMRSGIDRHMFARLLVQIYRAVNPANTLVDGILALEGQGPGKSGKPRDIGVLVGSRSGVAVDKAICRMLGIAPDLLPTNRAAAELGLEDGDAEIRGDFSEVKNFELPDLGPLTFGPMKFQGFMRKHLVQRPVVDPQQCKMCGECGKFCPAEAITGYADTIGFDYNRCIRCYCCIEVCPHGALRAAETFPGKILRKLTRVS